MTHDIVRYTYVANGPTTRTDPNGNNWLRQAGKFGPLVNPEKTEAIRALIYKSQNPDTNTSQEESGLVRPVEDGWHYEHDPAGDLDIAPSDEHKPLVVKGGDPEPSRMGSAEHPYRIDDLHDVGTFAGGTTTMAPEEHDLKVASYEAAVKKAERQHGAFDYGIDNATRIEGQGGHMMSPEAAADLEPMLGNSTNISRISDLTKQSVSRAVFGMRTRNSICGMMRGIDTIMSSKKRRESRTQQTWIRVLWLSG